MRIRVQGRQEYGDRVLVGCTGLHPVAAVPGREQANEIRAIHGASLHVQVQHSQATGALLPRLPAFLKLPRNFREAH